MSTTRTDCFSSLADLVATWSQFDRPMSIEKRNNLTQLAVFRPQTDYYFLFYLPKSVNEPRAILLRCNFRMRQPTKGCSGELVGMSD